MNTEWIYLALYGLMMAFCCYHMMRMMMNKESDAPEQADTERVGIERVGAETPRANAETARVSAETADAFPPTTN